MADIIGSYERLPNDAVRAVAVAKRREYLVNLVQVNPSHRTSVNSGIWNRGTTVYTFIGFAQAEIVTDEHTKKNHGSPVGSSIHPTLSHLGLQLPNTRLLQVTVDEIEGEVFLIQPVASPVPSRIYMTKMGRLGSPSHVTTHFNVTTAQFETLIGKSWILPYIYIYIIWVNEQMLKTPVTIGMILQVEALLW